ncbi:MAG: hypothetical protein Q8O55_01425 [Dehalococcoidales bacterium]|nr:hypothetical protein [Dehalococcoidales bacterium]
MGTRQYIIPVGSMSLTDQKEYRYSAIAAGLLRSQNKAIGDLLADWPDLALMTDPAKKTASIIAHLKMAQWPKSIDMREFQPLLDAGVAAGNDRWITAALAAIGTAYSAFSNVATPALGANRLVVFFKIGVQTAPLPVNRVIFRTGAVQGNILAQYDLEQMVNRMETDGYFSEPVVIDPSQTFAVQVLASIATGVAAQVQLGAFVFEPSGNTNA